MSAESCARPVDFFIAIRSSIDATRTGPDGSSMIVARAQSWSNAIGGIHRYARTEPHRAERLDRQLGRPRLEINNQVDVGRHSRVAMENNRDAADDDIAHPPIVERVEEVLEETHEVIIVRRRTRRMAWCD
jgi:hypothetical protein